ALLEGTASVTGGQFFPALVRSIARALGVRYAFVTELLSDERPRLRILAIWVGDRFGSPIEYDLFHTPCENVIKQGEAYYPDSVQELFPKDKDLVALGAVSYLGIALVDGSGKTIGHLCILDDRPLPDEHRTASLLKVFASRAAAELERKRAEEALWESERQLRLALEERERLSQDLHDNIIQTIYAIGLGLEECQHLMTEDSTVAVKKLRHAVAQLNIVIRDVRNYIVGEDPDRISASQLKTELTKLARAINDTHSIRFRISLDPLAASQLTPEETKQVLSIAHEAMSNSLQHSGARSGFVSLQRENGTLRLTVEDSGAGFDAQTLKVHGHGLQNIAARARKLGAHFQVISGRGHGTRILVDIPKEQVHASTGD
ncbi:MAG: GAF domain-containing sensor histidine kinase, partial [Nitrospiraceae bacterium]